jgi:hypothetical protein
MAVGIRIPLQEAPPESKRYTRDVFLYAEHGDSQCGTCRWWTGPKKNRCAILGTRLKVDADDSCSMYVSGAPNPDQPIQESMTPAEAGFVTRKVQCQRCKSFDPDGFTCGFYTMLNDLAPDKFDLDERVAPMGCCTAQKAKRS